MARIAAVHGALPPYRYAQGEITAAFARMCLPPDADRGFLDRLHRNARVAHRHLALPLEEYGALDGFGAANDRYLAAALDLGAEAICGALKAAGLAPGDVDMIACVSTTGVATPSLDARLAGRLGLREDVTRLPLFGLGCAGGAAGLARVHDHLRGHPDHVAVLLSVELCSLTLQRDDLSPANLVAAALFGDGAAAVVACGDAAAAPGPGPAVVASRSRLYPCSEGVMGWRVTGSGFRVVLDAGIPDLVRANLAGDVRRFLGEHGLTIGDITAWVCHPGGPKVLDAVAEALALPEDALDVTWRTLAEIGNVSSASVLFALRDTLARRPPPGSPGLLIAMGPGFCSELVLLRW